MSDNEYAVSKEDLSTGGGGNSAKPRGQYDAEISRAESKKDTNGKAYLAFGLKITAGKFKNGLLFENYLPLPKEVNGYQKARRGSFYTAIGLKEGALPYGAPVKGAPDAAALNGTPIKVTVEHEFQNIPGEEYTIVTSNSSKLAWKRDGWDKCVDDKGRLVRNPRGEEFPAPISPREVVTFYAISDDFEGVGGADDPDDDAGDSWG